MGILKELNNLAKVITGTNPKKREINQSIKYIADNYTGENDKDDINEYFENEIQYDEHGEISNASSLIKKFPENLRVSNEVTNLMEYFSGCYITELFLNNTSHVEDFGQICVNCTNLKTVHLFDTSSAEYVGAMFMFCEALENVPVFNFENITDVYNMESMFSGCSSLSNESLNNILLSCANSGVTEDKELRVLGITEEQANICKTLSNYQVFLNAGWTTGYDY